jgi:hypothetical protein
MSANVHWLVSLRKDATLRPVDGLVSVNGFQTTSDQPAQTAVMLKAKDYGADAVFFEASRNGRPPVPQAFIFVSDGPAHDPEFAKLHRRLWSWGGVPLLYRKTQGLVQLFRCAHKPDFASVPEDKCNPFKTLNTLGKISSDPWWDNWRLRNGTIWDDPTICGQLMSEKSAHKLLLNAVKELHDELNEKGILKKQLRRKLLILSLLIAYLEERGVLLPDYFGQFLAGANRFFQVLADGDALIDLLKALEAKFNGNVFKLEPEDAESLRENGQLARFAKMVEAKQERTGQRTLWELYSFKDLPIELISHIYQMFVEDKDTAIYTPPFLVRLMLDEALSWERIDWLNQKDSKGREKIIADFSLGSGVFLVEAYKRLVLHWRSRNGWKRPAINVLKGLLKKVHGIDLEKGAVQLAAFSLYLAMCDALEPEETRLTSQLCGHLNSASRHSDGFDILQFRPEEPDEVARDRTVDLVAAPSGVAIIVEGRRYVDFDPLLPIECKRLPTPKASDRDEREYVFSKFSTSGGIQRFKCGHHGAAHSLGAMIGFVQEETTTTWHERTGDWIRGLAASRIGGWAVDDLLQLVRADSVVRTAILESRHDRGTGRPNIELRHLWVEMN